MEVEQFHEIPNSQKIAFLVDIDTCRNDAERLHNFIIKFDPKAIDHNVKVVSMISNFPEQKTRQMKLMQFKVRDAFFDDDEDFE